jgi:hypothetical protein
MVFITFAMGFAAGAFVMKHWDWIVKHTTKGE